MVATRVGCTLRGVPQTSAAPRLALCLPVQEGGNLLTAGRLHRFFPEGQVSAFHQYERSDSVHMRLPRWGLGSGCNAVGLSEAC